MCERHQHPHPAGRPWLYHCVPNVWVEAKEGSGSRRFYGPQPRLELVTENPVLFWSLWVPAKLASHAVAAHDPPQLPPGMCCGTCRSQLIRWLDETIALRTGGATVPEGGTHCCARGRAALRGGRTRAAVAPGRSPAPVGRRRRRTELRVPVQPRLRSPARPIGRVRPGPPAPSPSGASPVVPPGSS